MRILTLLPKLPGDPVDGHVIRTRPLLKHLVQRAEVDILSYDVGRIDEEIAAGAASWKTIPVQMQPNTSALHRLRTFFSADDVQPRYAEFSEALSQKLSEAEYDLVLVAGWKMLLYLPEVRRQVPATTKILADVVDDEVRSNWQDLHDAKGPRARATMARRLLRNSLYQRTFLSHADLAMFVAERDADSTRKRIPRLRVEVNQNGVDTDYFAPREKEARPVPPAPVLLFEGTMSYAPNVEGATYLVEQILPLVQREIPDARVIIVGRDPKPEITALASDDVEVTGTVEDVREHMARGSLLACSLRSGTGLKNKILQSWAMGIPVVATPISIPGLGAVHGENLLVAEGAKPFADECIRLLKSPELAEQIGEGGRKIALERYSIQVKLREIDTLIGELLGDRASITPASLAQL